ncbi:hypothetical protein RclHR1_00430002 [Rhizophagus clarus]|uniref:ATP-dependent DNA helicase Pif1 n=2 Tax=Rhizophagus clarus TaxID=94130 RepID=A0A2Z6RTS8_9GLOM|nr:hypothetical protein RclHR1_00430002 [Rhizophagus clarus]GES83986.1 ATP-dependent DNA helicase Pif1 [Rhizophagus clarus]
MPLCKSCKVVRPEASFKYIKDKLAKTCNSCLTNRQKKYHPKKFSTNIRKPLARQNNDDVLLETRIERLSQIVQALIETNNTEGFGIIILLEKLDQPLVEITKSIRKQFENGDGYKWNFDKTTLSIQEPDKIGTTYFTCSQSSTLSNYKNSNRKRMVRYECNGRLTIWVNLKTEYAHIQLQHDHLHERPSFQPLVPDEIKDEIERNKHLDPLKLCNHLSIQFDMSNITGKQIYYWWSLSVRSIYQYEDDPIKSAIALLDKEYQSKECMLLMTKSTSTLTAIGFSTSFLNKLKNIKEIHIDATYKTAKGRFELYGIIGEKYRTGFALGYLILDVVDELESTKTMILSEFLSKFKELKLEPEYIFTDKDFAEINAARSI